MKLQRNKDNKSQKIIDEEKAKIKEAKKRIKEIKHENFKKSKFYKRTKRIIKFIISDKDNYTFSEVLVVTILSIILGAFACFSTISIICGSTKFIKMNKETQKFYEAYETLVDNYYGEVDKETLIEGAISGMMTSVGDNYTTYSDSDSTDEFNEVVNGIYEESVQLLKKQTLELLLLTCMKIVPQPKLD